MKPGLANDMQVLQILKKPNMCNYLKNHKTHCLQSLYLFHSRNKVIAKIELRMFCYIRQTLLSEKSKELVFEFNQAV